MLDPIVGIITALPKEFAAVKAGLKSGERDYIAIGAKKSEVWRCEVATVDGILPVVLFLSGMGNNVAAMRASQLLGAFPSIQHLIMCGIAGGVPHPTKVEDHVRLGDIVVADKHGVFQYGFDKETETITEIRACPRPPSASLTHAVFMLEADRTDDVYPWEDELNNLLQSLKGKNWKRPKASSDILLDTHDKTKKITHPKDPERRSGQPRVFYGAIGSADKLLKNPIKRDMLRDKHSVRAIEMEGSGIADATWGHEIGYLVVRGICDYCDSKKGDNWQQYAAAVAAAYTLALLRRLGGTSKGGGVSGGFPTGYEEADREHLDYAMRVYVLYGCEVRKIQDGITSVPYLHVGTQLPGFGQSRALVTYLPQAAQSHKEIQSWLEGAERLAQSDGCGHIIVIHDRNKLAFNKANVSLISITSLESHLFDVRPALSRLINEYKKSDIFDSYIPLQARSGFGEVDESENAFEIDKEVMRWFSSRETMFVTILGDYGEGKSTLAMRLQYLYAEEYVSNRGQKRPLLIQLRDYTKSKRLDVILHNALIQNYSRDVPLEVFWGRVKGGDFVLLLDGFDEMVARSTKTRRKKLFHELAPLLTGGSPVVLTCRPAYFVSADEYNDLLRQLVGASSASLSQSERSNIITRDINQFEEELANKYVFNQGTNRLSIPSSRTARLLPLSGEQIDAYLQSRDAEFQREAKVGWMAVRHFLESVYDLKDLMRRPIILRMISDTVVAGHINIQARNIKYGPSGLYRIYTNMEFTRDWDKGASRQLLNHEERAQFAILLALTMLRKGGFEVDHADILQVVNEAEFSDQRNDRIRKLEPEELATYVRTCSFLTVAGKTSYRFVHRSFMEYFAALYFQRWLTDRKISQLLKRPLSYEVLYFLGGFAISDPPTGEALKQLVKSFTNNPGDKDFRRNIVTAYLYSDRHISNLLLDHIELHDSRHHGAAFKNFMGVNVRFTSCHFESCKFEVSSCLQAVLQDCHWNDVGFERSRFDAELLNTRFQNVRFFQEEVSLSAPSSVDLDQTRFTKVKKLKLKGAFHFWGGRAEDTKIHVMPTRTGAVNFHEFVFVDCSFVGGFPAPLVTLNESAITRCVFWGITIGSKEVRSFSNLKDSQGYFFVADLLDLDEGVPVIMFHRGQSVFINPALLNSTFALFRSVAKAEPPWCNEGRAALLLTRGGSHV